MESSRDATTTEQLSSRIDSLRGSIWTNLTATTRHQHIAEMDYAWGGRGWIPPWPRPDGTFCTVESLPSTDILDLASITRFCTQHNARLSSLWDTNGILGQMAERASPGAPPVWSRDSGAKAVLEVYSILSSEPRSDSSLPLRDASHLHGGYDMIIGNQGPRKRLRASYSEDHPPANTAKASTPTGPGSISEALKEAQDLQQTLQSFTDTLRHHLERFPLEEGPTLDSKFERIHNEFREAQAECARADAEVSSCEQAYRSLQQGSNATASRYNILKEWLEPILLVNRARGDAASSTVPHDPVLQDAMEAVSREARQTLESYCGAVSGEDTLQSLARVLDQVEAARTRQQEARVVLSEAQSKMNQVKPKLELASLRALLIRTMRETADMVDAARVG
ncbi:unnamed protein product [Clonostachys rosea]|uniref:Uncharacterized protein n=1 Tax=Bionectria ochroleuca TaxID=29856 RepID=A0ABY6TXW7_BIOOC|nr:unnamed protein product [Clonostachys rosea]